MFQRRWLAKASVAAGFIPLLGLRPAFAVPKKLVRTPRDAEGPFYPVETRDNDTPDLLQDMTTPRGKILHFKGHVLDTAGNPQSSLVVDIWHTDSLGRYKHPSDPSRGERFDDFAYFGKASTDADGAFAFRTYIPGAYSARPAHIHYIIWDGSKRRLTSQVYFKGLDKGSGAIIASERHDLREAKLMSRGDGEYETDFRVVI